MGSVPKWLVVGTKVATLRDDWKRNNIAPVFTTIDRVGKRDVVLTNGERFNISRLQRQDGGTWGHVVALLPPDAPAVVGAQAAHEHNEKVWRAKTACEDFRFNRRDLTAVDVILALAPLTGRADEIAALFDRSKP